VAKRDIPKISRLCRVEEWAEKRLERSLERGDRATAFRAASLLTTTVHETGRIAPVAVSTCSDCD
jgi:hypothetical protein